MATFVPKRFNRDSHIDWRGILESCLRASIGLTWFTFVIVMLAVALERAP